MRCHYVPTSTVYLWKMFKVTTDAIKSDIFIKELNFGNKRDHITTSEQDEDKNRVLISVWSISFENE